MAGHSKWANIQHRMVKQDKPRSKMFSKLAKEITVAAKMGMPDPDMNPRLRLAIKAVAGGWTGCLSLHHRLRISPPESKEKMPWPSWCSE